MKNVSPSPSGARGEFVRLCQRLNYGKIENLRVRNGQPVLDPLPIVTQELKFAAADHGPPHDQRPLPAHLKQQVVELFALFDRVRDDTIAVIEVKSGLPFRAFLSGESAA